MDSTFFKRMLIDFRLTQPQAGLSVLTYHGLVDRMTSPRLQRNFHTRHEFEDHLDFLKAKNFRVINAIELCNLLKGDTSLLKHNLACITFDDGYENNLMAIDILKRKKLPGIFFVSTASINSASSIWTVNLSLLLLEGTIDTLKFGDRNFGMRNFEARNAAFDVIRNELKKTDRNDRLNKLQEIESQFPADELMRLMYKYSCFKMLTWNQIRSCQSDDISFQSHGHRHEIHNAANDKAVVWEEAKVSKEIIEKETNQPVHLFAYPNGAVNSHSEEVLRSEHYCGAFVLGNTAVKDYKNHYGIPRSEPSRNPDKFKLQFY